MNGSQKRFCVALGVGALVVVTSSASFAISTGDLAVANQEVEVEVVDDLAQLALPPVPTETQKYLNEIQLSLDGDPQFSAIQISEDRKQLNVWWYGEANEELSALLLAAPDSLERVVVQQTQFLPGYLRSAAQQLLAEGSKLGVQQVTVAFDGSGLQVAIDKRGSNDPGLALSSIETELAKITDAPLEIINDSVVPS